MIYVFVYNFFDDKYKSDWEFEDLRSFAIAFVYCVCVCVFVIRGVAGGLNPPRLTILNGIHLGGR